MLRPSYTELMGVLNDQQNMDNQITSRYTIVIAAAKRARQLIDGEEPIISETPVDKAVSIAVSEMNAGKILIKSIKSENDSDNLSVFSQSEQMEAEGLGVLF